jgi:hypothetical protein
MQREEPQLIICIISQSAQKHFSAVSHYLVVKNQQPSLNPSPKSLE